MTKRMLLEEAKIIINTANAKLLSAFEKASGKINVACIKCGYQWTTNVTTLRKSSCKPCGYKRNAFKRLRPIKEIVVELDAVDVDYISDYIGANYPLKVKHRKCGHITNNQKIHVLNKGFGCSTCWRVSDKEYHLYAKRHGGSIIKIASSTNNKSIWRCKNGCEFNRSFDEMKRLDRFCNICSRQLSERICKAAFEALFYVKFDKRKIPNLRGLKGGMLEFDLYNDSLKIAIEHHGSHHYRLRNKYDSVERLEQQKKHDELKRQYCKNNRIFLFEIPELFYKTSLKKLPDIIFEQANSFGLPLPKNFRKILTVINPSGISTSDEVAFKKLKAASIASGYHLLEKKFRGGHSIHKFLCDKGHLFECYSYSFLQGHRCGKCYEIKSRHPVFLSNGKFFGSANEAGRDLGVDSGTIHSALNRKHRVKGLTIISITLDEFEKLKLTPSLKSQLLLKTDEIELGLRLHNNPIITSDNRIYLSQLEASKQLVNNPTAVGQALKRKNSTVSGVGVSVITQEQYNYLFVNPNKIKHLVKDLWPDGVEPRLNNKRRVILSDGRLFNSCSTAADEIGVSISAISTSIKRKGNKAKIKKVGVQFIDNEIYKECLSKQHFLEKTMKRLWPNGFNPTSPIAKSVMSNDGILYNSVKEAASVAGVSAGHMSNSIKSGNKIKGLKYKYQS